MNIQLSALSRFTESLLAASPEGASLTAPKEMKKYILSKLVAQKKIINLDSKSSSHNLLLQSPTSRKTPLSDGETSGGGDTQPHKDEFDDINFDEFDPAAPAEVPKDGAVDDVEFDDDDFEDFISASA